MSSPYPKKPLTGYFRFAAQLREEAEEGVKVSNADIKEKWEELGEDGRKELNDEFYKEMQVFKEECKQWEEKYGKPEKKSRSKKEVKEISKPQKEKGAIKKERKSEEKKRDQSAKKEQKSKDNKKEEKGKSKGKPVKSKKE